MWTTHVPLFSLPVGREDECALACAHQQPYSAHPWLLSVAISLSSSLPSLRLGRTRPYRGSLSVNRIGHKRIDMADLKNYSPGQAACPLAFTRAGGSEELRQGAIAA